MDQELVFATAFNIKRTLLDIKVNGDSIAEIVITDAILNKDLHLPKFDMNTLKILYLFLENPKLFIQEHFEGWKDTYSYLIEEAPAFHIDDNCEYFLKDFFNVKIPQIIISRQLIDEARSWAKANASKLNPASINEFKNKFVEFFNDKYDLNLTSDELTTIERPNSGQEMVKNDIEEVKNEIFTLLKKFDDIFSNKQRQSYEREFKESRYKYKNEYVKAGAYVEIKISNDLAILKHSIIEPLNKQLVDYIFLKFNKDHKYERGILELLNFRPCKARACTHILH